MNIVSHEIISVLLFTVILSGLGTHIYNERQEKIMNAEFERERRLLGYGDPEDEDEEMAEPEADAKEEQDELRRAGEDE